MTLDLELIDNLVLSYAADLQYEQSAIDDLVVAKDAYETERSRVLADAYRNGLIDGKNEQARKLQEAEILEQSAGVDFLFAHVKEKEAWLNECTQKRKTTEVRLSMYKAWLYSLSNKS